MKIKATSCQLHVNTPPIMTFERNWVIPETEEVGSVITRVGARDNDADFLIYGIEPISFGDGPPRPLPFRINNATGVVYLNESLKGRAGENINLYVTAFNGDLPVKTEVWVKIVGSNSRSKASLKTNLNPFSNTNNRFPPSLLSFTNFNSGQPPASIANNPRPFPGQMSYFPLPTNKPNKTRLLPAQEKQNEADTADNSSIEAELTTLTKETTTKRYTYETNHINTPIDQPVKSVPDLTITLVPIVSVVAIFLGVGIIALLFRKKICMGRIKESKDDMRKESSGAVVLQDDPSLTMQYWRGPRAFSNRYVPWEREAAHPQVCINCLVVNRFERAENVKSSRYKMTHPFD
ncbi:hypothetical protein PPYR_04274 [Photinus pyralis]|uniref:Cadherin domain-containing protein n=1 Tax=Photinus pyralis TaxID=7054 RepID=A0A5N4AXW7_PHOPY|nr:hypothetical protein PPYR_04274 [Photinus pyralis]